MRQTRLTAVLLLAALILALLPSLGGCASGDWEGDWNRTGDATYARAEMTISDAGGGGFTFSMTLYNGNIAGQLTDMTAEYTDSSKTGARCSVPSTRVYIDFTLNDDGSIDVIYGNELYSEASLGVIESDLFGFSAPAFVTGHYVRGETEYLNDTLYDAGVLTRDQDELVQKLTPDSSYRRLLDCYQTWEIIDDDIDDADANAKDPKRDRHSDEIGGYVYYGSNTMQKYAAILIMYDDGTASIVVSMTDGSLVYYSDNAIYLDGSITPLPVKRWMELYHAEQAKLRS